MAHSVFGCCRRMDLNHKESFNQPQSVVTYFPWAGLVHLNRILKESAERRKIIFHGEKSSFTKKNHLSKTEWF